MTAVQERTEQYAKFRATGQHLKQPQHSTTYLDLVEPSIGHEPLGWSPEVVTEQHLVETIPLETCISNKSLSWVVLTDCENNAPQAYDQFDSPFDTLFDQGATEERVQAYIAHIEMDLVSPYAQNIAARLRYLIEVAKEEEPDEKPVSEDSLYAFTRFLRKNPDIKMPSIVLTPSGNIRIQWRRNAQSLLVIEFYNESECAFVIFTPDDENPLKPIRLSGTASVSKILSVVAHLGALKWVLDNEG